MSWLQPMHTCPHYTHELGSMRADTYASEENKEEAPLAASPCIHIDIQSVLHTHTTYAYTHMHIQVEDEEEALLAANAAVLATAAGDRSSRPTPAQQRQEMATDAAAFADAGTEAAARDAMREMGTDGAAYADAGTDAAG